MALPAGFGRAAIVFGCTGDNRNPCITFGFQDLPSMDPNAVATAIQNAWTSKFVAPALASSWTVLKTQVNINRAGVTVDGVDGSAVPGTAAFNPCPLAVAAILKKNTALGGRSNRGRVFLPAGYLGELSVDPAGMIDSAVYAATTTRWNDFITALAALELPMMILHHAGGDPTGVDSGFCETMVATQRRRQRKVTRRHRTP